MLDQIQIQVAPEVPHSREAEEALLGAIQINPDVLPLVRGIIRKPEDFFIHRHRYIWTSICTLDDRHEPIDLLTIAEELKRNEYFEDVGGFSYLTQLVNQVPSSLNAEAYAKIVHGHGIRRRMITAANKIAGLAYDEAKILEDVVSECLEEVQLAANGLAGGKISNASQLASEFYDRMEVNSKRKTLPGIPTGFYDLDILLGGGLQDDDFIIAAGFPGMGKSGLLETIIAHTAKIKWTGLFTLEMSNAQQTDRIIAQMTGINSQKLKSGRLQESEWPLLTHAIEQVDALNLFMDDSSFLSFPSLRAKCIQWQSMGKLDLVVVDYAGLMEAVGNSLYEKSCYLSRNLKCLAKELHVPVLVAHQLNRKAAEQNKPTMHNLRDSGSWEQDADIVMLLSEPKQDATDKELEPRNLEVAKHRNGPTGDISLAMRKNTTKFESTTYFREEQ
jgi:replicative DNA helicase